MSLQRGVSFGMNQQMELKDIIYFLENDNIVDFLNNLSYNNLDFKDLWKDEINNFLF